jgi:hypothetical protein
MTDSHWSDLDPARAARIKQDLQDIVEHAVEAAMTKMQAQTSDAVSAGITKGLRAVVNDEELFAHVVERIGTTMRAAAAKSTGAFVLGGAARVFKLLSWIVLAFLATYSIFGWAGVAAAWKYLTTAHTP